MRQILLILTLAAGLSAADRLLGPGPYYLRSGEQREWTNFSEQSPGAQWRSQFDSPPNAATWTLLLRQQDVKRPDWTVTLNGMELGRLAADERYLEQVFPIPAGLLRAPANELRIAPASATGPGDDIAFADVRVIEQAPEDFLSAAAVTVRLQDEKGEPVPGRITIAAKSGALAVHGVRSSTGLAARTGVVYTVTGTADLRLPSGEYVLYGSRGFEYSAARVPLSLKPGANPPRTLAIRREVSIPGYIGADLHVHTFELSRHGDASVAERVVTLAGEGLDFAIATEHNQFAGYAEAARAAGAARYFTVAPGSEITTAYGHFNIFPVDLAAPVPDWKAPWPDLLAAIRRTPAVGAVIQNHPRDVHSGYRPFDASHYLIPAGESLDGHPFLSDAMELVNSGAMRSDILELVRDWFALLNRGYRVAGVGTSDSHTVDVYPVGQARTYIRTGLTPSGGVDPEMAAKAVASGGTLVSYGLAATLAAEASGSEIAAKISVYGPSWSKLSSVVLYENGSAVRTARIGPESRGGLKWSATWRIAKPTHDAFYAVVATGPGVLEPYWEVRKPYQPASPRWEPSIIGISSAEWVDANGDGKIEPARTLAEQLVRAHAGMDDLAIALAGFHPAVATQAALLLAQEEPGRAVALEAASWPDRGADSRQAVRELVEAWKAAHP